MAELREQVYRDEGPAERLAPVHEWIRSHPPGWTYTLVRIVLTPIVLVLYRTRAIGREHVPAAGFILAPNHFSHMDHFFAGARLRQRIQFMSKAQLYDNAVLRYVFRTSGMFPVRRGHHDEEAFITAHAILDRGGCVGMYAEGGRSRADGPGEVKPGLGRLALESGLPVVPVAIHGSKDVRGWKRLRFPKVTVQFGEPVSFEREATPSRERQLEVTEAIFGRVRAMYDALDE